MALYRDEGLVLRTYRLGEADRIVVLLTRGRGKVRAVAKGVRKTTSRFGARLEPTSHVALQLYEGRELDTVTQAVSVEQFGALREDYDLLTRASVVLEAVDAVSTEGQANPRLFTMALGALRTLADGGHRLVVPAFCFKLLALEGYRPIVERCVVCQRADALVAFDVVEGGLHCTEHRRGSAISPAAVDLLQQVLGGRLGQALQLEESGAMGELDVLATTALEHHLERRLRSATAVDHR